MYGRENGHRRTKEGKDRGKSYYQGILLKKKKKENCFYC